MAAAVVAAAAAVARVTVVLAVVIVAAAVLLSARAVAGLSCGGGGSSCGGSETRSAAAIGAVTRRQVVATTAGGLVAAGLLESASAAESAVVAAAAATPGGDDVDGGDRRGRGLGTRARGAAELDAEYYVRDLFGGNKREGSVSASRPPDLPPPRQIQEPLLSLLLPKTDPTTGGTAAAKVDDQCIPIVALLEQIKKKRSGNDDASVVRDIQRRLAEYRDRAERSFEARAAWQRRDVSDQYYFDLTSYALWRTAADLIPNYEDRDAFARRVGTLLYEKCRSDGLLRSAKQQQPLPLSGTIPYVKELLDLFVSSGYCKGYRVGDKQLVKEGLPIFDELDDEAMLTTGATVDCLVSVYEPATLGASLQITGEQSRFVPDYVAATLAALWNDATGTAVAASSGETGSNGTGNLAVTWEIFFVDNVYRPNPKDYFPNEQLIQFSLTRR